MLPPVARRFVAGEEPATALEHARQLNDRSVGAIVNLLGEHYGDRGPADADAAAYRRLVEDVASADLRARLSVKPTQLGLAADEAVFRENLGTVIEHADDRGVFVWVDMEGPETVEATLSAYEEHARAGRDVGVCLQANLARTPDDIDRLADAGGVVRLVKGAYDPPTGEGYSGVEQVDEAYEACLERLFRTHDRVAVASHDPAMLARAATLHEAHGTPYEVQMLMGVRTDVQYDLASRRDVWQYVPYGRRWLSYFSRRVTERWENAAFAARALLGT
ncbi:proline dehydrogenase family protein [Salinirussus salinus]|uniref:proline dehydrogenase family protein n=1 Tax=Salinirussus salinus TaxID=1198300 RepID=UPI00135AF4BE|nr:proline dehydrogenase family protein [Salinirussus salinus]